MIGKYSVVINNCNIGRGKFAHRDPVRTIGVESSSVYCPLGKVQTRS